MFFRAVAGLEPGSTLPADYAGPHLKTHSFEPESFEGRVDLAVFLFGDILSAVASTRLRRFEDGHFRNCGAGHLNPAETNIFEADHLNYERMFDAWMQKTPVPHIAVRYERLHALAPAVSALIGAPLPLVDRRRRRTRHGLIEPSDRRAIRQTYGRLIEKVEAAADLTCWL
jgi:hypothetical protein